jgi:N-methylhydantoinase B
MIPDSGGAGKWRGGLGFAREYRILADEVRFSMRTDKHSVAPWGGDGGADGGRGACVINPRSQGEKRLPSRFGDHPLRQDDIVRIERPGGGGLGNPLERPVAMVLEDVRQGYVSMERAFADYGVALDSSRDEFSVNREKTERFRGKITKN